jgi:hypothetical protein
MPDPQDIDQKNDSRFLTPLLVMGLIIAAGILLYAYTGHAAAAAVLP